MFSWFHRAKAKPSAELRPPAPALASFSRAETIFEHLYERPPNREELERIRAHGVQDDQNWVRIAHRMVAIHDRQIYPTAFIVRFGPADVSFYGIEGFEIALDMADESVSIPIQRDKEFEPDVTNFFKRELKPGMTFVDVGANIGFFSMLASSLVGANGSVQAFEPNSENCRLILLSRERNGFSQLRLNATALGREAGTAFFSPALGSNGGFIPQTSDQLLNPQCVVVPVVRLDDAIIGRVDAMKMDVEGAEAMVLDGAPRILLDHRPIICTEFSVEMLSRVSGVDPAAYLRKIEGLGYAISRLDRPTDSEIPLPDTDHFLSFDAGPIGTLHELVFRPR